ncbi:MAG TPA: precorrin-3B C(17)-methyltransferase [Smithellaceae bacterium]|nr:precorrin-3B C(17)-methyltransferase [Smithellaceae bacterium]
MEKHNGGNCTGKLYVVGIGPGGPEDRTRRAEKAIAESNVVAGYKMYLDLIKDLTEGKKIISSGMTREVERCRAALDSAAQGNVVALVSSGDAGIYGMAGLALELNHALEFHVPIETIPGVTSATAAAARIGSPLMLDFAVISLSDLLLSWETIRKRIEAVAGADLVIALYNPKSKKRTLHLKEAVAILLNCRPGSTPVGIVTDAGRPDEKIVLTSLDKVLEAEINMTSIVIIGNSTSKIIDGKFITPRGYRI